MKYEFAKLNTVIDVCKLTVSCLLTVHVCKLTVSCIRTNCSTPQAYFNRVYTIITLLDGLVCITLIPISESSLASQRTGFLFSAKIFCWIWGFLWSVLSILSVFMISVLSVSRLVLLLFPLKILPPTLARLVPGIYFLFISGLLSYLLAAEYVFVYYDTRYVFCTLSGLRERTPDYLIQASDLRNEHLIRIIWICLTGLPFFPITCSFVLSVYCLRRTQRRASRRTNVSSSRRQVQAATTILIVTLLYIVCNIPAFVVVLLTVRWRYTSSSTTVRDMYESLYSYYDSNFLFYYAWFVACPVSIGMNSLLNPIVYYWRIAKFRKFIARDSTRSISMSASFSLGIRSLSRRSGMKTARSKSRSSANGSKEKSSKI